MTSRLGLAAGVNRGFLEGLAKSWLVILSSEIGDKTFFIAAVMAMRNSRKQVRFSAAFRSVSNDPQ